MSEPRQDTSDAEWVSDMIVDVLAHVGCRYVMLTPGSSFRGLHDSLVNHAGEAGPHVVMCVNEQIAVSAAHAYSKATGDVAVVVLHDLVGLLHAQIALYNAWTDGVPLVILGGAGPRAPAERRWIDWLHSSSTQAEAIREFTKADEDPDGPEDVVPAIERAVRVARTEPRGPVYVALDVGLQETRRPLSLDVPASVDVRPLDTPTASPAGIATAARWLVDAARPVLVPGRIGLLGDATETLIELAEMLGAACVDEPQLVTTPTSHPLNLSGDRHVVGEADVRFLIDPSDVRSILERAGSPEAGRNVVATLKHMAPGRWSNARRALPNPDLHLASTGIDALVAVRDEVARLLDDEGTDDGAQRHRRRGELARRHRDLRLQQRGAAEVGGNALTQVAVIAAVHAAVEQQPWLLGVRHPYAWPEGLWDFPGAGRFLGGSGGGGLGYGPGALLGAGLAARDREQIAVGIMGDGDWLMNPTMVWSAAHYRVPLLAVVLDNRAFGNDVVHQKSIAIERRRPVERAYVGTAIDEPAIDIAAQARAAGAAAEGPVHGFDDLREALERAVGTARAGGVAVVHARVEAPVDS